MVDFQIKFWSCRLALYNGTNVRETAFKHTHTHTHTHIYIYIYIYIYTYKTPSSNAEYRIGRDRQLR